MRLLLILLCLVGCSSLNRAKAPGQSVRIELKPKPGAVSETRYYSHANVKTYSDRQLLRDKREIVDFTILTSVQAFDPKSNIAKFKVKTVKKDGIVDLHDLAFPELGEEVDYEVHADGRVLKAGAYPPNSLFFVPSFPVPKEEVQVGDTWTMEHGWNSARDGIPLKLDIVGILKDLIPCEGGKTCADIEISGHVKVEGAPMVEGARFDSRVWGRMLFSPDRGEVIWSEMRSQEEMGAQGEKMTVLSCMVSETKLGAKYKTKNECEPSVTAAPAAPKL